MFKKNIIKDTFKNLSDIDLSSWLPWFMSHPTINWGRGPSFKLPRKDAQTSCLYLLLSINNPNNEHNKSYDDSVKLKRTEMDPFGLG